MLWWVHVQKEFFDTVLQRTDLQQENVSLQKWTNCVEESVEEKTVR